MRTPRRTIALFSSAWRGKIFASLSVVIVSGLALGCVGGVGGEGVAANAEEIPPTLADDGVIETFSGTQDLIIEAGAQTTTVLVKQLEELGVSVTEEFNTVLDGAAVTVTQQQLEQIRSTIDTASIAADSEAVLFTTDTQGDPPWNLDRIDQQDFTPLGTAGSFTYPASAGAGVTVFVIDSGFTRQNGELDGRIGQGIDFAGGDHGTPLDPSDDTSVIDCNEHGTHVAGTVASTTYGVAKLATVVPVRVFGCNRSTLSSTIVSGIEWVVENRPQNAPAVINMSLGTIGGNSFIDLATQAAIDAGITVVVAAGNGGSDSFGDDACFDSTNSAGVFENGTTPARLVDAITVGATGHKNSGDSQPAGFLQDLETYFSNYGTCVDLLAPGGFVTSLDYASAGTRVLSGTSMAAPLVAGIAALYLSENPGASPAAVEDALVANAASGKISGANLLWPTYISGYPASRPNPTPNLLVNTSFMNAQFGDVSAPVSLAAGTPTVASVALTWSSPLTLNGGVITDYRVQYRLAGTTSWTTFLDAESATTGATVTGLAANRSYQFQVVAKTAQGFGAYSAAASQATLSGITSVPLSLVAGTATTSRVPLTWSAPLTLNGGQITDYRVQYRAMGTKKWLTFAHTVSTARSAAVTGLLANTRYQFKVAAKTAQGFSLYTTAVTKATRAR